MIRPLEVIAFLGVAGILSGAALAQGDGDTKIKSFRVLGHHALPSDPTPLEGIGMKIISADLGRGTSDLRCQGKSKKDGKLSCFLLDCDDAQSLETTYVAEFQSHKHYTGNREIDVLVSGCSFANLKPTIVNYYIRGYQPIRQQQAAVDTIINANPIFSGTTMDAPPTSGLVAVAWGSAYQTVATPEQVRKTDDALFKFVDASRSLSSLYLGIAKLFPSKSAIAKDAQHLARLYSHYSVVGANVALHQATRPVDDEVASKIWLTGNLDDYHRNVHVMAHAVNSVDPEDAKLPFSALATARDISDELVKSMQLNNVDFKGISDLLSATLETRAGM